MMVDLDRLSDIGERIVDGAAAAGSQLPRILNDPRGYPRDAMILAAVAALALIVIVLIIMAFIDARQAVIRHRALGSPRRRYSRLWLIALATFVGGAALVTLLMPAVPRFAGACGSCHATEDARRTWEAGTHRFVSCYGCHAAPGVLGILESTAQRLAEISPAAGANVDSRSCLACHQSVLGRLVSGEIVVRHKDIIASGSECIDCHPAVGHKDLRTAERPVERALMSRCLACHDGQKASAECGTCHRISPSDPDRKARLAAVTPAKADCAGCHLGPTAARCDDCHGLDIPHPAGFVRKHAGLSAKDPSLCVRCHETATAEKTCECHGEGSQHGAYSEWYPKHSARAATSGPGGCLCHNGRDFAFCGKCHDSYPFGGIPAADL